MGFNLSRLRYWALVGCLLLGPGNKPSTAQTPSQFANVTARVEATIGAAPADCGRFSLSRDKRHATSEGELRKAVACMKDHAKKLRPAWMVEQGYGTDSFVAYGVLVGPDGRIRRFDYDGDPSGGAGATPRFTVYSCESPVVRTIHGMPYVTCK